MQHERIRERISIDVTPEEHRKIEEFALFHGNSIKEYVLESIRARIRYEIEEKELLRLMTSINPPLKELWDNETDAAYERESETSPGDLLNFINSSNFFSCSFWSNSSFGKFL